MSERIHIKLEEFAEEDLGIWDEQRGEYIDVDYLRGQIIEYAENDHEAIILILAERNS